MKVIHYWKSILIALVILYASLTSGENLDNIHLFKIPFMDKIIHFIMYLVFSISLLASFKKHTQYKKITQIILDIIIVVPYGILMEILQYYVATARSSELFDALSNTVGCLVGILIFPLLSKSKLIKYL